WPSGFEDAWRFVLGAVWATCWLCVFAGHEDGNPRLVLQILRTADGGDGVHAQHGLHPDAVVPESNQRPGAGLYARRRNAAMDRAAVYQSFRFKRRVGELVPGQ